MSEYVSNLFPYHQLLRTIWKHALVKLCKGATIDTLPINYRSHIFLSLSHEPSQVTLTFNWAYETILIKPNYVNSYSTLMFILSERLMTPLASFVFMSSKIGLKTNWSNRAMSPLDIKLKKALVKFPIKHYKYSRYLSFCFMEKW